MFAIVAPLLAEFDNKAYAYLGAGISGLGCSFVGVGQGILGQGACLAIGRNPEMASKITSTMIVIAGIAESGAIYGLVISILLIFVA